MNVEIKDFVNINHINLRKVHLSQKAGVIYCPNLPLHGKHVIKESSTVVIDFMAGKYGKTTEAWYLNQKDSQIFDTFDELVKHYHN
jgi:hypothetical protein